MARRTVNQPRATVPSLGLMWMALVPAAVTALVFVPEFFRDPRATEESPAFTLLWLAALLLAGPVAAYLMNRRQPVVSEVKLALLVGLPQLPLVVVLVMVDVWLDVRSGYLLAGSGEEAMAYGIGAWIASITGVVLVALVAVSARLGARR